MKDFAQSYEQKKWASAVASYERYKPFLLSKFEGVVSFAAQRIAELEQEYPQLKETK